jgi:hypothetical protein
MGSRHFGAAMNHAYIDANCVAERYLTQSLSPEELRAFEEHIVDCQECADRLLLAEMFHTRNGHARLEMPPAEPVVARVVLYKPKRVLMILIAACLVIPIGYLLWILIR